MVKLETNYFFREYSRQCEIALTVGDHQKYSSHHAETESVANVGQLLSAKTECLPKCSFLYIRHWNWNQNSVDLYAMPTFIPMIFALLLMSIMQYAECARGVQYH